MTSQSYHEPAAQPFGAIGDLNGRRPGTSSQAPLRPAPDAPPEAGRRPDFSEAARELRDAWGRWRPGRGRGIRRLSLESKAFWGRRALELGRITIRFHDLTDRSYNKIAALLDVTAGQVHHYISLDQDLCAGAQEALTAGRIPFKVARTLADVPPHRQYELLPFFLSGVVTSCDVESVIRRVLASPERPAEDCLTERVPVIEAAVPEPPPELPEAPAVSLAEDLQRSALALAGKLQMLKIQPATYVEAASLRRPLDLLARELMSARVTIGHESRAVA